MTPFEKEGNVIYPEKFKDNIDADKKNSNEIEKKSDYIRDRLNEEINKMNIKDMTEEELRKKSEEISEKLMKEHESEK